MAYCKHCKELVSERATSHNCTKVGLLNIDEDDSFLVSTLIGMATDSTLLGGMLGGSFAGAFLGDVLAGDDDSDDSDDDDDDSDDYGGADADE